MGERVNFQPWLYNISTHTLRGIVDPVAAPLCEVSDGSSRPAKLGRRLVARLGILLTGTLLLADAGKVAADVRLEAASRC